jgi:RNA polymerase sigma-70 factor (ECF subfamily)
MAPAELSDAELVRLLRSGDEAAWAIFVERYSRYVLAIATRAYRLREQDAEDVFQELFARAHEHLGSLRDDNALRPWVAQLTRRLCVDRHRSAGPEELGVDVDEAFAADTMERIDEALAVQVALAMLSPDCQEVLDRFFCRDESYRQIGAALDIPNGTIASRISRCLEQLRRSYEGSKPPPMPSGDPDDR